MMMSNISAVCFQGVFDSSGKEKRLRGYIKSKVTEKRWCLMVSDRHLFYVSGPSHLTSIDWKNTDHQRSVAASLVQGVKVLEVDHQEKRKGHEALAPPWWEFFHFELVRPLVDDDSWSIFGAIYELKPPHSSLGTEHSVLEDENSPHFVIAFRGTLTMYDLVSRDLNLSLKLIKNRLHKTSRFETAMQAIRATVGDAGDSSSVWLAGHSMGSVLAMLAGKTMAKDGIFLKSFLFNQPFVFVAPMERIKQENVKLGIRFARSVFTAGLAKAVNPTWPEQEDPFFGLYEWVPNVFVNQGDDFCSGYIGYFEHRKKMVEIGAGGIERLATQNSIGSLLRYAVGKETEPPMHLIPCADLTVNMTPSRDFKEAHGIRQWWRENQNLKSETYRYR
ncbi:PREDICTED: GDSL esterase/lipase At4g10955-like [Fragaria vesca subsp. vesca]|uniref:GDSL esterase/lipase At4g10955-like n=1 Tax=Fragaria vesca subsp. vesca TaxID=101020 RepID=UPI0002C3789F|nr:PREDICTED: GDSL esterase/lipase At4g10955-like [Fragaria vesca subsp. vesca]